MSQVCTLTGWDTHVGSEGSLQKCSFPSTAGVLRPDSTHVHRVRCSLEHLPCSWLLVTLLHACNITEGQVSHISEGWTQIWSELLYPDWPAGDGTLVVGARRTACLLGRSLCGGVTLPVDHLFVRDAGCLIQSQPAVQRHVLSICHLNPWMALITGGLCVAWLRSANRMWSDSCVLSVLEQQLSACGADPSQGVPRPSQSTGIHIITISVAKI